MTILQAITRLLSYYEYRKTGSAKHVQQNSNIAPFSDIPIFYIKYLIMHKVHMHVGAIRQLLYGCEYVREIIHWLMLVDYPPVHTHKPYNNFHL